MRSIGDAIRPATDMAAKGLTAVAQGITKLSDGFPAVVMGIGGVVAAILAFKTASSAFKIGRGVLNIARGRRLGRASSEDNVSADLPKTGSKVVDAGLDVLGKVFAPRSTGAEPANDPVVGVTIRSACLWLMPMLLARSVGLSAVAALPGLLVVVAEVVAVNAVERRKAHQPGLL